jgi:hypothetical protein
VAEMRVDIKKVKGKEYLQYTDNDGHIYHIGSATDIEKWKIAYWLFGSGLMDIELQFFDKMRVQIAKRFEWNEGLENTLENKLGEGMQGYVGYDEFSKVIDKIYGEKVMLNDNLRKAVKLKFPALKKKRAIRRTVDYNRRLLAT